MELMKEKIHVHQIQKKVEIMLERDFVVLLIESS
jgi:hypothetical protein